MKPLNCAATQRRLQAFHDGELSLDDQIGVGAHLEWCDACAEVLAELRVVGAVLRTSAPGRACVTHEEAVAFTATVVSRASAERDASLFARVRELFDDMHLVYAGLGAAAATVLCGLLAFGMVRFASHVRPDSLAAIVDFLATPAANDTVVVGGEEDAVFTLAAVVTREGRITNLELLRRSGSGDAVLVEGLLDAVARARVEPAPIDGMPVAASMVWLSTHTTVRGRKHEPIDVPLPAASKKRAAAFADAPVVTT